MKEIVLVLIIAVGIAGVGVGFAQNTISLSLEDLGFGEDFIDSPISSYTVDPVTTKTAGGTFITACKFKSGDSILPGPATIICKLTDGSNGPGVHGKVVAEGKKVLCAGYPANTEITIPITQKAFPKSNSVKIIKDIKIVTLGTPVTGTPCP